MRPLMAGHRPMIDNDRLRNISDNSTRFRQSALGRFRCPSPGNLCKESRGSSGAHYLVAYDNAPRDWNHRTHRLGACVVVGGSLNRPEIVADEIIQILGKLAPPPWGRDQKLAALAAWSVLEE